MKFRLATLPEYISWFRKYIINGGKPSHVYNRPFDTWGFLTATEDFRLSGDVGSAARSIILGDGVNFLGGNVGHCNLFFQDGSARGFCRPVFSDLYFYELGINNEIEAIKRKDAEIKESMSRSLRDILASMQASDLQKYLNGSNE